MIRFKFSRRIGSGGMGDVFLALQEGIGGFEKLVVVKRIHPHLTADQAFVDMFLNEARLVAKIRHPNVVEILDIQRDADGLFIVLEYISGETIYYIMRRLAESGQSVPPAIACRLVADLAEGLHAAHETTDTDGEPLGIVHRDVTPSNLIVGYNGVPKILDFGVAAGAAQRNVNEGAAVGKIGYQAPEQIAGLDEDERSDVFQLAICLHEMLSGKPLFANDDEHEAMLNVVERPIPKPSELNPDVPPELDEIVMNALTLDWEQRTKTAEQLGQQIEQFLDGSEHVSQKRVGEWMRKQFADRYDERVQLERDLVNDLRSEVIDPAELPDMFADGSSIPGRRASPEAQTRVAVPRRVAGRHAQDTRRGRGLVVGGLVAAVAAGLGLYVVSSGGGKRESKPEPKPALASGPGGSSADARAPVRSMPPDAAAAPTPAAPKPITVAVQVVPETATISLDGVLVGTGNYTDTLARDGSVHTLEVSAHGYKSRTIRFKDTAPPARVTLEVDPAVRVSAADPRTPDASRRATTAVGRRRPGNATKPETKPGTTAVASKRPSRKADARPEPGSDPKQPTSSKPGGDDPAKNSDPWQNRKKTDNKNPWK